MSFSILTEIPLTCPLIHGNDEMMIIFGNSPHPRTCPSNLDFALPQGTSVISPVIPFGLVVVPAFIIAQKSTENVFEAHPAYYILAFGMVAAKVTNRLVVAHMTKSEMNYLDWGLLGPLLLFLNQYFNNFLPERLVLWLALIWGAIDMVRYCIQVRG